MKENIFQQIESYITHSPLPTEKQRAFIELFAQTKEEALRPVLALMDKDSAWVERLYENYIQKKDALTTGNMDAWKDAIEKEKAEIERN
tara:strand:+ start:3528 stop:3794 length:267 start_codon:yes stop_codon:yes gene_type:complete